MKKQNKQEELISKAVDYYKLIMGYGPKSQMVLGFLAANPDLDKALKDDPLFVFNSTGKEGPQDGERMVLKKGKT